MPYVLSDLVIDRVDFVEEGANSAAFIEICKRKEQPKSMEMSEILSKLKPEHAAVIQQAFDGVNADLSKARADLDVANAAITEKDAELIKAREQLDSANATIADRDNELTVLKSKECSCDGEAGEDGVCKACGKPKKSTSFDETEVLKSMPEHLRAEFLKMRSQKEAAEEQVRKNAEEKLEAEAVAKAATLKALPVEQQVLVDIIKNSDKAVVDVLSTVAAAIEGSVLDEVGKSGQGKTLTSDTAWDKIEAEAVKIAERDNITKQKAVAAVIKEQPELYKEYLNGGKQ